MPQAFQSSPSEADALPLVQAHELIDHPKPDLPRIVALVRKGEIGGVERQGSFFVVIDLDRFESDLRSWMDRTKWNEPTTWSVLPDGYVTLVAWIREHVSHATAREKRLLDGQKPPQTTGYARDLLAAGDFPEAMLCEGRMWAGRPADIKAWLWRRFGIAVR